MWQGQWSTVYIYYFAFYSTPSPCVSNSNFYFLTVRYSALSPHSLRWTLSPHLAFAYLRSMLPCPALPLCANIRSRRGDTTIADSQSFSPSVHCPLIEQRHQVRARCRSFTYYSLPPPRDQPTTHKESVYSVAVWLYSVMYIYTCKRSLIATREWANVNTVESSPLNVTNTKRNITAPYYRTIVVPTKTPVNDKGHDRPSSSVILHLIRSSLVRSLQQIWIKMTNSYFRKRNLEWKPFLSSVIKES